MPKSATTARPRTPRPKSAAPERRRFWLQYPSRQVKRPILWEMSRKFPEVKFDIRQATVNEEIGLIGLELQAPRSEIKAVIKWFEKHGVKVEPVEINVIES